MTMPLAVNCSLTSKWHVFINKIYNILPVRHDQQAVVQGTTNPSPCCHLCNWLVNASPLLPPSECNWLWAMASDVLPPSEWQWLSELWPVITNNLTFDPPTCLPELTQNWIRSSHDHSTPSLKISCKSVHPFSHNVADKETNKQRNKERKKSLENNTPSPTRGGVNIYSAGNAKFSVTKHLKSLTGYYRRNGKNVIITASAAKHLSL